MKIEKGNGPVDNEIKKTPTVGSVFFYLNFI